MANPITIEVAQEVRSTLAGNALTAWQAKLYSQRLRRDMGRDGLASFGPGDVDIYLDRAMLLLQCALLERRADPSSGWREGLKRAAEILEWLSQPSLKPVGAPLHLLSAAAYQLAGYPAMALGQLKRMPDEEPSSALLREFLRANFPATLEAIRKFWHRHRTLTATGQIDSTDLTTQTFTHIIMCIGTVCAYLRTGSDGITERALKKLENLAASLLHSRDPYSYLLAQLTAATCRHFVETCLWPQINKLRESSNEAVGEALVQFARLAFVNRRALVWPAQAAGIEQLRSNTSFVLCTPTGSGKTTVATLAVVQGLFADLSNDPFGLAGFGPGNLVLYLVPSRALAAEVESRLALDLKGITAERIVITGLYGGIDWGPTDAWIQTDHATIVICTFEKADALLRYLGVLFLNRVRLVVIDEAHMVEQDKARLDGLKDGSSRAFRLEQLGARLLRARDEHGFRVLALSAVAARAAPALARWISGNAEAFPTVSSYRSTRQMLGHLEVSTMGQYTIRYDLMDGRSLRFDDERRNDTPYVSHPFPPFPNGIDTTEGPEVSMRGPTLWAALQLAAERPDGSKPSVLISLTQSVEAFSATCADLMDSWPEETLPNYRTFNEVDDLWTRCLASAADYFTINSVEYRLLQRGIAVHHGKMPGLLARRLKAVIDRGSVRVIIATSTLSEGVNIPVNFLLIPNICRANKPISLQEFTNLIGRAGRPGVATEGSALVVFPERMMRLDRSGGRLRQTPNRQKEGYQELIKQIEKTTAAAGKGAPEDKASSPLSSLLLELARAWVDLTGSKSAEEFATWLEQTAVINTPDDAGIAFNHLDSLDAFLIAALQEVEELRRAELTPDQVEGELTAIWRRTYAFAAAHEQEQLAKIWLTRGRVIKTQYPDAGLRRRIYRTSLAPRSANSLLHIEEAVRAKLQEGADYPRWSSEERFAFIRDVLALLSQVAAFRIDTTLGRQKNFKDWPKLLRWWLAKNTLSTQPTPKQITSWYDFVAKNFIYRGVWGLGSVIGLLLDTTDGGQPVQALEIDDWPRTGLPWISFWMKELINWGTLDPVAAFLLARGEAVDRPQAEADAQDYYDGLPENAEANDILNPRQIRDWVAARRVYIEQPAAVREFVIEASLVRPAAEYVKTRLTVEPLDIEDTLTWIDPAGYTVARSEKPINWPDHPSLFDFELIVADSLIRGEAYLRHA
ncbi:DEAD/DEAH box helicase [Methylocaldum sp. 14B]|uniref:DEAD/DEAH box helicase n=1 Tax=Methylocaldum sp. 14B TaxID=1912213 RepID=UPI00098A061F|nr:DEAD/DEAH box helicase [Methylocaldum sp. 14B]